jgi:hypothetical protein
MSANADILLLAYSILLVGTATGMQMLYFACILKKAMSFGADPIGPDRLLPAGIIFSVAGLLAIAVAAVEILSGAAGVDIRPFGLATVVVPAATLWLNARRQP